MNPETIDSEYQKLQQQGDQVSQSVQAFSTKLQTAAAAGDANAKDWLVELQALALQVQQEQLQVQSLLQAMHDFTVNHLSQAEPQPQQPVYAPQPSYGMQQGMGGGMLGRFLGGGFGRSIAMGAGFGLGDDLIRGIHL